MCLICILNLKEFHLVKVGSKLLFKIGAKKKNVKKIGQFLEAYNLQTTYLIFFKYGM